MRPQPTSRTLPVPAARAVLAALAVLLALPVAVNAQPAPSPDPAPWPAERRREVLDKTLELRLAPDLAHLSDGERRAVEELLAVGQIMQRLYEEARHHQAAEARAALAAMPMRQEVAELTDLYRLFQGPIATTLDNRRQPFLAVDPEVPGKNVYPWGIEKAEVEAFLAADPERRRRGLLHPLDGVARRPPRAARRPPARGAGHALPAGALRRARRVGGGIGGAGGVPAAQLASSPSGAPAKSGICSPSSAGARRRGRTRRPSASV